MNTPAIHNVLCAINEKLDTPDQSVSSTVKAVSLSSEAQTVATANPQRVELWICNASEGDLYLAPNMSGNIDSALYSTVLHANDTIFISAANYQMLYHLGVQAFSDKGGTAMITEFYLQ